MKTFRDSNQIGAARDMLVTLEIIHQRAREAIVQTDTLVNIIVLAEAAIAAARYSGLQTWSEKKRTMELFSEENYQPRGNLPGE